MGRRETGGGGGGCDADCLFCGAGGLVQGLGSALSEAGSDVRAVGVEAWGELCGEAGLVRDGGGRVGVAEET